MVTTPKKTQQDIINFFKGALKAKGVETINSSRGIQHLRINYAGDVEKLMNSILPVTFGDSPVKISGSYTTSLITIRKEIPSAKKGINLAKKGDQFFFILATRKTGEIRPKELTPDKLKLGGKTIKKNEFKKMVARAVEENDKVKSNVKLFLNSIMDASEDPRGIITSSSIKNITESDLNVIAKDFGELSGALWFMINYNPKVQSITYPKESNQRLVDYYANIDDNVKISISAKANEGAPPSIDTIANVLDGMKYNDQAKESARKAIIAIRDNSVVDGIVEAAKALEAPGYVWLKKNFFKRDFNAADCETILKDYRTPKAVLAELDDYYKLIGRSASETIAERIFASKARRWGLIISPMGYSLIDQLNKNSVYLSVLNDAAKQIKVTQLFMRISKATSKVEYKVKEFDSSNFKFEYNANAGQPGLKKISFRMDKH